QACFCPDGTESGTQACDGQHLSACVCPAATMPGGGENLTPMGATTNPGQVCADLRGKRACNATSYVSEQIPASVLFVVDRSGSMACNAPPVQSVAECEADPKRKDPAQPSRWETTVKAL